MTVKQRTQAAHRIAGGRTNTETRARDRVQIARGSPQRQGVRPASEVFNELVEPTEMESAVVQGLLRAGTVRIGSVEDRVLEAMRMQPAALWSVERLADASGVTPEKVLYALEANRDVVRQSVIPTRPGSELYGLVGRGSMWRERWVRLRALIAKRPY